MRIALVLPLLVALVKRFGWLSVAVSLAVALVCSKAKAALGEPSTMVAGSVAGAILMTGRYVFFFLLGIIAAARIDHHKRLLGRISAEWQTAAVVGMVFVCGFLISKCMAGDGYIDTLFGLFAACWGWAKIAISSAPAASINFISRKDKTRFAYPSPPSGSSLDWKRLS
jgi:hypothetical protein